MISNLSPQRVSPGDPAYIEGAHFDEVVAVRIGDIDAEFAVITMGGSGTETLFFLVPWEAVSGPVTVKSPEGAATTASILEVFKRPGPIITKISPPSSSPGGSITLEGKNLTDVISITFNGVQAGPFATMMDEACFVRVPDDATTGPITLTTKTGSFTTAEAFVVSPPPYLAPVISSVDPGSAPPGTSVVIHGSNLVNILSVKFNGIETQWSGEDMAFGPFIFTVVPERASTGPITITTRSDSVTSSSDFTVESYPPPALTSFYPENGEVGSEIILNGRFLSRASEIRFNGVPARFFLQYPTASVHALSPMIAIVPTNAATGPITIVTPEGSFVTTNSLTVLPGPQVFGSDLRSAPPGTEVQLVGTGLETAQWLMLGDVSVSFSQSTSGLLFTVPADARSGPLRIGTANGRVVEAGMFYVQTPADPLAQWASRGRVSESFASIAYGNGVFVAVGTQANHPGILSSRDGIAWTVRPSPSGGAWYGVAYGENLFVVVGDDGRILTSIDGNVWTRRDSNVTSRLLKAAWGDAGFVVVGERGVLLHSADGITWEAGVSGTTETLSNITWGKGLYVAGGNSTRLIVSDDGLTWRNATVDRPYAFLTGLTFADGLFVGVGNGFSMTSTDGEHWTRQDLADEHFVFLKCLSYGAGKFIAASNYRGIMLTSTNGIDWRPGNVPSTQTILAIAFGQERFVAGGHQGAILTSADGETWRREAAGNPAWLSKVAFGNSRFVAVGGASYDHGLTGRGVLISQDGGSWIESNTLESGPFRDSPLGAIAFDGHRFVALTSGTNLSAQLSADGANWVAQTALIGTSDIVWADDLYVSVGFEADPTKQWWPPSAIIYRGVISVSLDGWDWTQLTFPSSLPPLRGVAHGGGVWAVVGDGVVLRSTNGVTWEQVAMGTSGQLYAVTYGAGKFVAVGYGSILVSSDGVTWSSALPPPTAVRLLGVVYGDAGFVAVGESGAILTSLDGLTWTGRTSGTVQNLSGVVYGNGMYVIVGDAGVILRSAPISEPVKFASVRASPATLELELGGTCASDFMIEASTNLIDWVPVTDLPRPQQGILSIEKDSLKSPKCFYRAVLVY